MSDIEKLRAKVLPILRSHGVVKAGIFGSFARGEEGKNSDVDILIEVKGRKFSLFDMVGLKMELEKETKRKVDLVTYGGISPHLKKYIMEDEIRII